MPSSSTGCAAPRPAPEAAMPPDQLRRSTAGSQPDRPTHASARDNASRTAAVSVPSPASSIRSRSRCGDRFDARSAAIRTVAAWCFRCPCRRRSAGRRRVDLLVGDLTASVDRVARPPRSVSASSPRCRRCLVHLVRADLPVTAARSSPQQGPRPARSPRRFGQRVDRRAAGGDVATICASPLTDRPTPDRGDAVVTGKHHDPGAFELLSWTMSLARRHPGRQVFQRPSAPRGLVSGVLAGAGGRRGASVGRSRPARISSGPGCLIGSG